jgi:hypothetical protein
MRKNVERNRRGPSRLRTYLYTLSGLIIVCALIYWEQTALLYVVSTLAVCALLLAVAFADLEGKDRELFEAREGRSPAAKAEPKFAAAELPQNEIVSEVVRR